MQYDTFNVIWDANIDLMLMCYLINSLDLNILLILLMKLISFKGKTSK